MKQMATQAGQTVDLSELAVKAQVAPHTAAGISVAHLALGFPSNGLGNFTRWTYWSWFEPSS